MRFVGLSFSYVIVAVNVLVCSVTFSQSPSHTDLSYGTGQEVVDMYLAESPAPTPVYIWGHAKGQTHKRVPKDAVSLCLDAGYSFLSIEANDDNHDGIQDLYIKEPWLKILDFVIANAAKYNIDPENIFIGGRSLGSMGSFPAAMERWKDVRGVYSMQALPTGGKAHAALVSKNSPPCHLIYRSAPGSGNHDPLNGMMIQDAYRSAGIADRFAIKTETRDRQWFDGFVEFVQAHRIGGKGDQRRATQAALKRKARETSAGSKPTQSLHRAAASGDIDGLKAVLVQGVDIDAKDDGGRTPLHLASQRGHQALVKYLISRGADVNAKEDRGNLHATPLHHAVHGGHRDVVETLLVHGADANMRDRLGQTPLDLANRRRRTEIAGLLRKHGAKESNQRRPQRRQAEPQTQVPDGVRLETDIAYREGNEKWRLDLAYPKAKSTSRRPGLVIVHGGGWRGGDKGGGRWRSTPLQYAAKGYVCISVNYRLTDEAPFPACVEDVKSAVRWLRAHAVTYGLDPLRIGAYGNSAGAHLVAMLGLVGPGAGLEGDGPHQEQSSLVQAVCCSATPSDFSNWGGSGKLSPAELSLLAGPTETLADRKKQASPMSYVGPDAPPFLIIHGTADRTVPFSQGKRLATALKNAGAKDVTFLEFEDAGHGVFGQHSDETYPAMESFFARTLNR